MAQTGPEQEILPLPGIYFFDGWRAHPRLPISGHLPRTKDAPVQDTVLTAPKRGYTLQQLWADSEPAIGQKFSPSYEVKEDDILRAVTAIASLPPTLPDSPFM